MQTSINNIQKIGTAILTMPTELRVFVIKNAQNPSPYNRSDSGSFYDCTDKSWDYTPDGSIRVSDHWNFWSQGRYHCLTDICDDKLIGKWVVAKYSTQTGLYHVISIDDKDNTAINKRRQREDQRAGNFLSNADFIRQRRLARAAQIRREKAAAERAKKIKNGFNGNKGAKIWVEVEVNVWSRSRGRNYHQGTQTLFGFLTWESKTGKSFVIETKNGDCREIRSWVSYKEFSRKPRK